MTDKTDVMVITAHPDDAEFGVAGTVARWTKEGKRVVYVVCTSGDKGTTDPTIDPEILMEAREKEQRAAAAVLGVSEVIFLRHPDQELEDTPEFRKQLVRLIRTYRPETVVSMDPYRRYIWHRDHRILGQVVLDALFPFARDHLAYPDMLEEGLMPHKVREALFFGTEDVNYYSEINDTFDLKLAALKCHESQVQGMNIPDLDDWLWARCKQAAAGSNCELAEVFHKIMTPP